MGTVSVSDTERETSKRSGRFQLGAGGTVDAEQRHTIRPTGVSLNARVTCPSSSGTRRL